MCDSCETRGGKKKRRFESAAKKCGAGVDVGNIAQNSRYEFILLKGFSVASHGDFVFGSAIDVVKNSVRKTTFRDEAKICNVGGAFKAALLSRQCGH